MSGFLSRLDRHGLRAQLALYGIGLCLIGGALAFAIRGTVQTLAAVEPQVIAAVSTPLATPREQAPTVERRVLSDEAWAAQLRSPSFWAGRRSSSGGSSWSQPKSGLGIGAPGFLSAPLQQAAPSPDRLRANTYATMCVRLCDGYYYPISHATTRDRFSEDDRKCKSSCGADARLFVFRNEGGSPDDMEDLKGDAYSRLKTAFLYRKRCSRPTFLPGQAAF